MCHSSYSCQSENKFKTCWILSPSPQKKKNTIQHAENLLSNLEFNIVGEFEWKHFQGPKNWTNKEFLSWYLSLPIKR